MSCQFLHTLLLERLRIRRESLTSEEQQAVSTVNENMINGSAYYTFGSKLVASPVHDISDLTGTKFIIPSFDPESPTGLKYILLGCQVEITEGKTFGSFLVAPALLASGVLLYKKKLYCVSADDVIRRRFSLQHQITANNTNSTGSEANELVPSADTSGPLEETWLEDLAAANLAFEEQAGALLHLEDC